MANSDKLIDEDQILVISCFDEGTHGGLYCYSGDDLERIDDVDSSALLYEEGILVRCLYGGGHPVPAELLLYDAGGVWRYWRVDEVFDVHDLAFHREQLVLASTLRNSLVWLNQAGKISREWRAQGEVDSWHLNGLCVHGGELYATAFGRFSHYREWKSANKTGVLFHVESGHDVAVGLNSPHSPVHLDGSWVLCNSFEGCLVRLGARGQVNQTVNLGGWTRGIASSSGYIFVGISAPRHSPSFGLSSSRIAVLRRADWKVIDMVTLPAAEVSGMAMIPRSMLAGLRSGFRLTGSWTKINQLTRFSNVGTKPDRIAPAGEPLKPDECKISIEGSVPDLLVSGSTVEVDCTGTNRGAAVLVSAPPNPVAISWRWREVQASGGSDIRDSNVRIPLPRPIAPGRTFEARLHITAPREPRSYQFLLSLVQEHIAWFDDLDPQNGMWKTIVVVPAADEGI